MIHNNLRDQEDVLQKSRREGEAEVGEQKRKSGRQSTRVRFIIIIIIIIIITITITIITLIGEQKRKYGRQSTRVRSRQYWWSTQTILLIPHMMSHNNQCGTPQRSKTYASCVYITRGLGVQQLILPLRWQFFPVGGKKKHYWLIDYPRGLGV